MQKITVVAKKKDKEVESQSCTFKDIILERDGGYHGYHLYNKYRDGNRCGSNGTELHFTRSVIILQLNMLYICIFSSLQVRGCSEVHIHH